MKALEEVAATYQAMRGLTLTAQQLELCERSLSEGATVKDWSEGLATAAKKSPGGHFTFGAGLFHVGESRRARSLREFAERDRVETSRQRAAEQTQRTADGLPSAFGYRGRKALAITNIRMALARTREKLGKVVPEIEAAIEQGRYVADEARTLYAAHIGLIADGAPVACRVCKPDEGQYVERNGVRKFESTYRPCTHNRAARAWAEMEKLHGAT